MHPFIECVFDLAFAAREQAPDADVALKPATSTSPRRARELRITRGSTTLASVQIDAYGFRSTGHVFAQVRRTEDRFDVIAARPAEVTRWFKESILPALEPEEVAA